MKISLITMHRVPNYGSVLQTYATSKILNDLGHTVEVIDYIPRRLLLSNTIISEALYKNKLLLPLNLLYSALVNVPKLGMYNKFLQKYLKISKVKYHEIGDLKNLTPDGDVFISGSDQVWNTFYDGFIDPSFFLDFVPANKKRIAYASSFGRSSLENNEFDILKNYISKYDHLSVRESSGVDIIQKMGREDVAHVLDPTFLLSKDQWSNLYSGKIYKDKYILMYTVNKDEGRLMKLVKEIADAKNLKIYYLHNGLKGLKGCDKIFRNQTPEEFLSLFAQAEYVVATSFHGTAFALNFNKPFISVLPQKFRARVESILNLTGLQSRMIIDDFTLDTALAPIDFTHANSILKNEKLRSINYLKSSLTEV